MYVYLLIEFQSRVDRYAFGAPPADLRVSLLWQDLIRQGRITADGLLPPVLLRSCSTMALRSGPHKPA